MTTPTIPRYRTGDRLYTREQLERMFRDVWGTSINSADVDNFVRSHFYDRGRATPTAYLPFNDMAELPDDEHDPANDQERDRIIRGHEQRRSNSRRSREVYRIDGLPHYVPSRFMPSEGDTDAEYARKSEKIRNLR